ncbi:MAG: hypothetical protein H0U70_07640 [Tatlockia sp.]|nr:hypothetical protein [Tatlockia sp.]
MKPGLDYKFLSLVLLNSLVLLVLFFKNNTPQVEAYHQDLSQHFAALNKQLIQLQQPSANIDLEPLKHDVNELRELLHQLHNKSDKQFDEGQLQLQQRLNSMQHVLQLLDEKQHPVKYLPASALPFKVLSIDSIQQTSVVSVNYDFKTIPLEKNDKLAGWTVTNLDFSKQKAAFKNNKEEQVIVCLSANEDKHG